LKVSEEQFWRLISDSKSKNLLYPEVKDRIVEKLGVHESTAERYLDNHSLFQETKGCHRPKKVEVRNAKLNSFEEKVTKEFEVEYVLKSCGADFLTKESVIEAKSCLNKSNFYKAVSQLEYALNTNVVDNGKDKVVVADGSKINDGKATECFRYIKKLDTEFYVMSTDSKKVSRDDLV